MKDRCGHINANLSMCQRKSGYKHTNRFTSYRWLIMPTWKIQPLYALIFTGNHKIIGVFDHEEDAISEKGKLLIQQPEIFDENELEIHNIDFHRRLEPKPIIYEQNTEVIN